jgi:hypothetical protein
MLDLLTLLLIDVPTNAANAAAWPGSSKIQKST